MLMLLVTNWDSQDLVNLHCAITTFNSLLLKLGAWPYCCAYHGQGSGPIHISNVGCVGNESSLTDCSYATTHLCHHGEDAAVRCQTSKHNSTI